MSTIISGENVFAESLKLDIGVLMQKVVLFDLLTPLDHFELFCRIKGTNLTASEKYKQNQWFIALLGLLGFDSGCQLLPGLIKKNSEDLSEADRRKL